MKSECRVKNMILFFWLGAICLIASHSVCQAAGVGAPKGIWSFFSSNDWEKGFQLNLGYLGHIGFTNADYAPAGGYYSEVRLWGWWKHLIELHGQGLYSVSQGTFSGIGVGSRLILLELNRPSGGGGMGVSDVKAGAKNNAKGVFAFILRSFTAYFEVDYLYYWFPPYIPPYVYARQEGVLQWGGGAQWGLNLSLGRYRNFYVDTMLTQTRINGVQFAIIHVGLGCGF
jgi:hypothetical protein